MRVNVLQGRQSINCENSVSPAFMGRPSLEKGRANRHQLQTDTTQNRRKTVIGQMLRSDSFGKLRTVVGVMLYSEFRDGNVPAGHEQLRVMQDCLRHLPANVTKVSLRSDTAGYQEDLLLYCGEGKDPRFCVIEFAIGADVTEAFRRAVMATAVTDWKPLV